MLIGGDADFARSLATPIGPAGLGLQLSEPTSTAGPAVDAVGRGARMMRCFGARIKRQVVLVHRHHPVLTAAVSQTGQIEKLDAVDFKRSAHGLKIAGLQNTVATLCTRNGRLRYPAPLRQFAHGPIEKAAGSSNLRARYVWIRRQLRAWRGDSVNSAHGEVTQFDQMRCNGACVLYSGFLARCVDLGQLRTAAKSAYQAQGRT
jgi:hypothetical protein